MRVLLTSEGLFAVISAMLGVVMFCLAPRLPSLLPSSMIRLVGFIAVCTSSLMLWALSESWVIAVALAGCALACMLIAHLMQTHSADASDDE